MLSWLLDSFTGLSALRLGDIPDPVPAAGEVVLELQYASLNPADRYLAEGQYPAKPPLPHVLGRDGIGSVVSLGAGVTQFKIGDQLLILRGETGVKRFGTFAQKVAVSVDSVARVPVGWTTEQAAGASLVYLTAFQALTMWSDSREAKNPHPNPPPEYMERGKEVVLITGASGGVGVASVQLARAMGHLVIALSRSAEKRETLKQIGADHVVDPTDPNWVKQLRERIHPRKVDLAIDNIGGPGFNQVLETLGMNGRVSVVGRLAGVVPEFNTASLFFRLLKIGGVHVGAYSPAESRAAFARVVHLLHSINAVPLVDRVFPFEQLLAGFERLAKGPMGKVLLKIQ